MTSDSRESVDPSTPSEGGEGVGGHTQDALREPLFRPLRFAVQLVGFACGAALVTGSPVRTLLAGALAALLYFKSGKEEAYLEQKHGEAYAEYQKKVPRLVPNVAGIGALFEAAFDKQAGEDESEREP